MTYATTTDGVKLYFEESGDGIPILFSHEFAGDYRSWGPQMRYFSRRHRCITYSARGYPRSEVPDRGDAYGQDPAQNDILAILDHLDIERAYLVGLSMGAYAALMVALDYPQRVRGMVLASGGSGSEPDRIDAARQLFAKYANDFERRGADAVIEYSRSSARIQYRTKDPQGFSEFAEWLSQHSPTGAMHTMRHFQGGRASLWDYTEGLSKLTVPTLIVVGDEDEPCIRPAHFLKRHISTSGLVVLPKTGHCVSQEEPDIFNRFVAEFIAQTEAGKWGNRDPEAELLPFPGIDQ